MHFCQHILLIWILYCVEPESKKKKEKKRLDQFDKTVSHDDRQILERDQLCFLTSTFFFPVNCERANYIYLGRVSRNLLVNACAFFKVVCIQISYIVESHWKAWLYVHRNILKYKYTYLSLYIDLHLLVKQRKKIYFCNKGLKPNLSHRQGLTLFFESSLNDLCTNY